MRKKIRVLILSALLLISAWGLPACAPQPQPPGKTVVTLIYPTELSHLKSLVEATYDDIELAVEINVSKSVVDYRLRAGRGPDLVVTEQPADRNGVQYVLPLGAYSFSALYESTLMKSVSVDGISYYLPLPGQYWGYIVNRSLFDSADAPLPGTNAELIATLSSLKEQGVGTSAEGYIFNIEGLENTAIGNFLVAGMVPEFLGKASGVIWLDDLVQGQATFCGAFDTAFDFPERLIEAGLLDRRVFTKNVNMPSTTPYLAEGKLAMVYGNSSQFEKVKRANAQLARQDPAKANEYVMMPFLHDSADGGDWTVAAPAAYIGMNRELAKPGNEARLDAAKRVLGLLSTKAGQMALMEDTDTSLAYLKRSALETVYTPEGLEKVVDGGYVYHIKFPGRVVEYLGKQGCDYLAGKLTVQEALSGVDDYYRHGSSEADYDMTVIGVVAEDLLLHDYDVRREETALGNLLADSVAEYAGTALAVVNGGGIRASLFAGEVRGGDLKYVCPFDNKIVVLEMSGRTLWQMLENGISALDVDAVPGGRFLQVSGMRYEFDGSKAAGQRLKGISFETGKPFEENGRYRVAVNDYMAGSKGYDSTGNGDGYTMLNVYSDSAPKPGDVRLWKATEATYRDALAAYFAARAGEPIHAAREGRIVNRAAGGAA